MRSSGDSIGAKIIHVAFAPPGLGAKIARKAIGSYAWNGCTVHHYDKESAARRLAAMQGMDPKFTTMIKNRPQDHCFNLKSAAPKLNWR
jgi:hypothetical protein